MLGASLAQLDAQVPTYYMVKSCRPGFKSDLWPFAACLSFPVSLHCICLRKSSLIISYLWDRCPSSYIRGITFLVFTSLSDSKNQVCDIGHIGNLNWTASHMAITSALLSSCHIPNTSSPTAVSDMSVLLLLCNAACCFLHHPGINL